MCNPPQPGDESYETFLKVTHFFVVCFFSLFLLVLLLFLAFSIAEAASPANATYLSFVLFCFFIASFYLLLYYLTIKAATIRKNWRWFEPFSDILLWNLFFRGKWRPERFFVGDWPFVSGSNLSRGNVHNFHWHRRLSYAIEGWCNWQDPLDFHNDVLDFKSRYQYKLELLVFLVSSSLMLVNNPPVLYYYDSFSSSAAPTQ